MALDQRYSSISDFAARTPDRTAAVIAGTDETLSFSALNRGSIALSNYLHDEGLRTGDRVAILMENCLDYFVAMWGIRRAGMYIVPVNWHLQPDEIRYIVTNSGARALITSARLIDVAAVSLAGLDAVTVRLTAGPADRGFVSVAEFCARGDDQPRGPELDGEPMYYSGGTSGKPKGILRPLSGLPFGAPSLVEQAMTLTYGLDDTAIYLSPAPLYHAAPIGWTMMVQRMGGTVVLMQSFDAEIVLRAIERHRVTHAQFVPTHFIRMLRLADEVRMSADLSSLRYVVHAAAPCPPEVKRRMLDWVGPIVYEFYGGSERCGFAAIGPAEAVERPGSVGRSLLNPIHILHPDTLEEVPLGETGLVFFEGAQPFEYHGEPGKSDACFNSAGWGTMGDMGRLDADGYLYLTDRHSNMIISGGVNIYPQEVEELLALHPRVDDVAVIGIPDAEFGERVHAVVKPSDVCDSIDEVSAELIEYCRARLAHYKCPRSLEFIEQMPRLPSGKLLKRVLLQRFADS